MAETTRTTTRVLARVLGPFLVLVPVTAAARAAQMQTMLTDFETDPLWPWIVGAFILLLGLIIVALHQVWTNPLANIVSALGWLLEVRCVLLLVFPAAFISAANAVIGTGAVWRIGYVGVACLGLYLSWAGWWPHRTND